MADRVGRFFPVCPFHLVPFPSQLLQICAENPEPAAMVRERRMEPLCLGLGLLDPPSSFSPLTASGTKPICIRTTRVLFLRRNKNARAPYEARTTLAAVAGHW